MQEASVVKELCRSYRTATPYPVKCLSAILQLQRLWFFSDPKPCASLRSECAPMADQPSREDPDVTIKSSASTDVPSAVPLTEKAGDHINRYKLLQEIGERRSAPIYMAEQEEAIPPSRRAQGHQARHGHQAGHRPLRSGTAGVGVGMGHPNIAIDPRRQVRPKRVDHSSSWNWCAVCRSPSTVTRTISLRSSDSSLSHARLQSHSGILHAEGGSSAATSIIKQCSSTTFAR